MRQKVWRQQEKLVMARYFDIKVGLHLNAWSSINESETMWAFYEEKKSTPSPRVTRILVPEKHRVMRKPC